jgi:hypothetical protein
VSRMAAFRSAASRRGVRCCAIQHNAGRVAFVPHYELQVAKRRRLRAWSALRRLKKAHG